MLLLLVRLLLLIDELEGSGVEAEADDVLLGEPDGGVLYPASVYERAVGGVEVLEDEALLVVAVLDDRVLTIHCVGLRTQKQIRLLLDDEG